MSLTRKTGLLAAAALLFVTPPEAGASARLRLGHTAAPSAVFTIIPALTPGSGWGGAADTAVDAQQGASGDVGYGAEVAARWVTVPFQTVGAGQTLNIGIVGGHAPSDAEYASGVTNNLSSVQVAVDNGTWQQAVYALNPDDGNYEWLVRVRGSDFSTDGQHELRARLCPTTGKCIVLQGPHNVGSFNGYISGNTLTITSLNGGKIHVGQSVMTVGGPSGVRVTALGTGTGGVGTYTISGGAQTYASSGSPGRISIGDQPGLFFSSNNNGTLPAAVKYAGPTGSDTTGNGTSGNPYRTISKARDAIYSAQSSDLGGGTICLQAGTNYSWGNSTGDNTNEVAATRWLDIRPSATGPCDSVNAGAVTIASNPATGVGIRSQRVHVIGVTVSGVELTDGAIDFGADYAAIWLDHDTMSGPGVTNANATPFGISQWAGGAWVNDTTFAHYQTVAVADVGMLVKNATFHDIAGVVLRGVRATLNVTADTNDPTIGVGNLTSGSPTITSFVGDTTRLSVGGYLALPNPALGIPNGTTITGFTSNTITMSANATASATSLTIWTGNTGGNVHPDTFFNFGTIGNVVVSNLHANFTTNIGQGFFTDANSNIINAYVADSDFFTPSGGQVLAMSTPSQGVFWLRTVFNGTPSLSGATLTDFQMISTSCGSSVGTLSGLTKRASPTC